MMERIVIVGYRPKKGKEEELKTLALTHWGKLSELGLVTERKPVIMKASDTTIVEIFGWKSKEAMESAHTNPKVLEMWQEFAAVSEYVPIGTLKEAGNLFSEFTPLEP